ncbi:hypothetical protein ACSW8S_15730 (plasmid) [Clostridium perfringens]
MNKTIKSKVRRRLLNDEILRNMDRIRERISDYKKFMDKESYNNSREVEALYDELRELGLDLFYVGR